MSQTRERVEYPPDTSQTSSSHHRSQAPLPPTCKNRQTDYRRETSDYSIRQGDTGNNYSDKRTDQRDTTHRSREYQRSPQNNSKYEQSQQRNSDHHQSRDYQRQKEKFPDEQRHQRNDQGQRYDTRRPKENDPSQARDYHRSSSNVNEPPPRKNSSQSQQHKDSKSQNSRSQHRESDYERSSRPSERQNPSSDYNRQRNAANGRESERQPKEECHNPSRPPRSKENSKNPSGSWEPRAQRNDPGGHQYQSQHDLSAVPKSSSSKYGSQHELSKNPSTSWEPKAQRNDPGGHQYQSQHDLSKVPKSSSNKNGSQHELSKNPGTSWEPKAQRSDPGGRQYQSQHDVSAVPKKSYGSQHELSKTSGTTWEPRAQRNDPGGLKYQSQLDLSKSQQNLSKSYQNLPYQSNPTLSKAHSSIELDITNPVNVNDVKDPVTSQSDARKYQRNSAYKPQQRQSRNLGQVPAASTQSLHNPQSLGHMNPAFMRSAVSLNPSAGQGQAGLAGQGDLSGGLSTSRLSLASQSISRNPSLASLVASNPSLYRTVSAFSLYEAGQAEPNSYLPVTIAGSILCCPIGIIGVLFSVMTRDAIAVRDYPAAVRWGSIALWTGVAFIIGGIVMIITLSLVLGLRFS